MNEFGHSAASAEVLRDAGAVKGSAELDRAIEVFVRGFGFVRSRTHPYLAERLGGVWVMRDAPRRDPAKYRREEWVGYGLSPADLYALAEQHTRGRYALCVVRSDDEDPAPIRQAYRELGFRLGGAEPFLQHRLADLPTGPKAVRIEQVTTPEQAERLRAAEEPGSRSRRSGRTGRCGNMWRWRTEIRSGGWPVWWCPGAGPTPRRPGARTCSSPRPIAGAGSAERCWPGCSATIVIMVPGARC